MPNVGKVSSDAVLSIMGAMMSLEMISPRLISADADLTATGNARTRSSSCKSIENSF